MCSDPSSPDPLPREQTRPELFIGSVTGFIENKRFRWNEKASSPGSTYEDIFSDHMASAIPRCIMNNTMLFYENV